MLRGLQALGGSGTVEEIYDKVVQLEAIPESVLAELHDSEKSNQTEVAYRLAWTRHAAVQEATRDGAPPIDLIDGDQLADKLKELGLGVRKELVERISIDEPWFESL